MLHSKALGKRLVARFNNRGAKRLHSWSRTQYQRVAAVNGRGITLDNVDVDAVFQEIDEYLKCFVSDISPEEFCRWFYLVPGLSEFGRTQPRLEVRPVFYEDMLKQAGRTVKVDTWVARRGDILEVPSSTERPWFEQGKASLSGEFVGAAACVEFEGEVASVYLPENEINGAMLAHLNVKYRCNPLSEQEWADVLRQIVLRRLLEKHSIAALSERIGTEQELLAGRIAEVSHRYYQGHKTPDQHKLVNLFGRTVGTLTYDPLQVQADTSDADKVRQAADEVRKKFGIEAQGCDADILLLKADHVTQTKNQRVRAEQSQDSGEVVSFNGTQKAAASGNGKPGQRQSADDDLTSDLEWGSF